MASLTLLTAVGCTSPNPGYDPVERGGPSAAAPSPGAGSSSAAAATDATVDGDPQPDAPCAVYYRDGDGDGWGDAQVSQRWCGDAPGGYVERAGDCDDGDARAFPGQTKAFVEPRKGGSFDFDCDGKATAVEVEPVDDCRRVEGRCVGGGWFKPLPACGQQGKRMSCEVVGYEKGRPICKAAYHYGRPPCR